MAHFLVGMPYILWDNIPRGLQIQCPHIERSCTSEYYSDRQLGVSEIAFARNTYPRGDSNGRCHPCRCAFHVMQMHQLISAALVTDADAQLISAHEHPGSSPASWGGETPPWNVGI